MTLARCMAASLLLVPAMMAGSAWAAGTTSWCMVADASRLEFFIEYSGQQVPAVFRRFDTDLQFDPSSPGDGRLEVTVETTSADFDSEDINEAVAGPAWFDVARHAQARFVSETIAAAGDGRYVATGRLRLKGIERHVDMPFAWSQTDGRATMRGELMLQRGTFAIGTGEWAASDIIGQAVRVRFEVNLRQVVE